MPPPPPVPLPPVVPEPLWLWLLEELECECFDEWCLPAFEAGTVGPNLGMDSLPWIDSRALLPCRTGTVGIGSRTSRHERVDARSTAGSETFHCLLFRAPAIACPAPVDERGARPMATAEPVIKPDFSSRRKHFIFTEEHDRLRESIGSFVE